MPQKPSPVTDRVRARVMLLHAKGLGRNEIAKLVPISSTAVTKIIHQAGESFDTSKTEALVQKRSTELAALRAELAYRMAAKANELISDLDKPFTAFNFGGRDNTYEEHVLDRPPDGAVRNLMQAASLAAQRSMELTRYDNDPNSGGSALDQWLAHMTGTEET